MRTTFLVLMAGGLLAGCRADAFHLFAVESPGHLGGGGSRAAAINNHDWVVGESDTAAGEVEAFIWMPGTAIQSLGTLGGSHSRAYDVNDDGLVVGESTDAEGIQRAFCWTHAEGIRALPAPAGTIHSVALAVNARGQIVGTVEDEGGAHPVLWEGTNMIRLHRLPGSGLVQPLDINGDGDVVGHMVMGADDEGGSLAFYFRGGAAARNLAEFRLLSGLSGSAGVAINQAGTAAGYIMLDSARVRAFRYDRASGLEILPDRGALFTTAQDINRQGWMVGSAIASYAADESACLWRGDRWYDLNEATADRDWWLTQGTGINDRGVVVGYGTRGEQNLAFILRPVGDIEFVAWPDVELHIKPIDQADKSDEYMILEAVVKESVEIHRVVFYENDVAIGEVDTAPYEWGRHGTIPEGTEMHVELIEPSGRCLRSPRITLSRP